MSAGNSYAKKSEKTNLRSSLDYVHCTDFFNMVFHFHNALPLRTYTIIIL